MRYQHNASEGDEHEDWDDDDSNEEWDDELDHHDDEGEDDLVACPECGELTYEDAERCPACGSYVTLGSHDHVWANRPFWWIALGLLGILAVILSSIIAG